MKARRIGKLSILLVLCLSFRGFSGLEAQEAPSPGTPTSPAAGTGAAPGEPAAGTSGEAASTGAPGEAASGITAAPTGEGAAGTADQPGEAASTGAPGDAAASSGAPLTEQGLSDAGVLEMDIRTSTLNELAAWCRSLGLGEGGGREELARRIREHYELTAPEASGEDDAKTIVIESARSSEYFTIEAVDEEYARLRGNVMVSLKDGTALHRIKAQEILYNRTRNIMSASGGVEYLKEDGDTVETFRGESIVVNLDNWSSVFMDSVSERSLSGDGTVYRFSGGLITRSDENATILSRAEISNAANEEAFWSIKASKIWLLPGSDWAIFNGILKVGEVPVLPIPFFFYPADETIFHPVIGFRSREGNFFQTTTYILGRPKADAAAESSISRILGASADMEKVREGVFLRSTGRKSRDPNTTRLSLLLDAYANLGAYLGTELNLPQKGPLRSMDYSGGLGFTRNVYLNDTTYTPFAEYDGSSDWNMSNLFSAVVPFRYRSEAKGSLSGSFGNVTWNFPFYSDPYVKRDFMNRSEAMDWFGLAKQGSAAPDEDDETQTAIGSYEWRLNGAITPRVTILNPFITSLSLSNLSSTVAFRTRTSARLGTASVAPERNFFYPDKFTLASASAVIQGTPLTLGNRTTPPKPAASSTSSTSQSGTPGEEEAQEDPMENAGELRPPWAPIQRDESLLPETNSLELKPPPLDLSYNLARKGGPQFKVDYRFNPSASSELQFRSSAQNWPEAFDVDWTETSSILSSFRTDGSTTFSLTDPVTSAYTQNFRIFGNVAWQDYSMMNEEAEEFDTPQEKDAAKNRVNAATFYTISTEATTIIKPLYWDRIWGASTIQYTLRELLVKSKYNNDPKDPQWENDWGEWDKEKVDAHNIALNLAALIMDKNQTLSLTHELPPEDHAITMDAAVRMWISETSLRQKALNPYEEEKRKLEPLSFSETLNFYTGYTANQTFLYDSELHEFTSLASTLTLSPFKVVYTASRAKPYELIPGQGWVLDDAAKESLLSRELRFEFAKSLTKDKLLDDRLSFSIRGNSSFSFDLQRYTNTKLAVSLSLTLGIAKFLDLSLSVSSENASMFRYFQDWDVFDLPDQLQGETNFFQDLANSFRFDDEALRRSSGFKLKSFTFSATHHLGDWNAKLGITLSPYLEQKAGQVPYYKFNNELSFIIQWLPITEIKTDLYINKDEHLIR